MKNQKHLSVILVMSLMFSMVLPYLEVIAESQSELGQNHEEFNEIENTNELFTSESVESPSVENQVTKEVIKVQDEKKLEKNSVDEIKEVDNNKLKRTTRNSRPPMELNNSGFVDRIIIESPELNFGGGHPNSSKISVDFSMKSLERMVVGDKLTLRIPGILSGVTGSIELLMGNQKLGNCIVSESTVTCEFNQTAADLDNVRGSIHFSVNAGSVPSGQTVEEDTSFGTDYKKQKVSVKANESGTESGVDFYKSGEMRDNGIITWWLHGNVKKLWIDQDIVMEDEVLEGHILDKSSFLIDLKEANGKEYTVEEFISKGLGTFEITDDKNFKIVVFNRTASQKQVTVVYKTIVNPESIKMDYFENKFNGYSNELYKGPISDNGIAKAKNKTIGGDIIGDLPPKGAVRIVKTIDGKDRFLENVKFKIYNEDGTPVVNDETFTTDSKGEIEISNLKIGKYYAIEIEAPDYVDFDKMKKYPFEISREAIAGVILEVENKTKTKSIEGTKTWKDDNSKDRPETITVKLLANNKEVDSQEVTEATNWNYAFTDLVAFDAAGKAIDYTIDEVKVDGYETVINDFDITNILTGKTRIVVEKEWLDDDQANRPKAIVFELLADGEAVDKHGNKKETTHEVGHPENWIYEFNNLPKYNAVGKEITYTVNELKVPGYESSIKETETGYKLTNTRVGDTSVTGTKTWKDDNSKSRPETITVKLLADGKEVDSQEVTEETDWKYAFTDLAAFDASGKAIDYMIDEVKVAGYETVINGFDITNIIVGKTEVSGTKTWKDDNSKERPETITVKLLANGKEVDSQEVTKETDWKYTFTDLAAFDATGKAIDYTIDEVKVEGYETVINDFDITNILTGKTRIVVEKEWLDDNQVNRPKSIVFELLADGETVDKQGNKKEITHEVGHTENWVYEFNNLPKYNAVGKEITYTVNELKVSGYESSIKETEEGYKLTNTRVDDMSVTGTKTWKDDNSKSRPETITVKLLANGKEVDSQEVTEETDWKYTFTDLAAFDATGKAIDYTIDEVKVEGYETVINGFDLENVRVGKTEALGTKTWKDDNSKSRPETITVKLLANGKEVDSQEVTEATNWKYAFTDLAAFDAAGKAIDYTIDEVKVAGYETVINNFDLENVRVGKTEVSGTKTWKDDNSKERPEAITVNLLANGKEVDSLEVTEATNWTYIFTDLAAFDAAGNAIEYEVDEVKVPGYETVINGFDIENVLISVPNPKPEPKEDPKPEEDPEPEPEEDPKPAPKQNIDTDDKNKSVNKLPSTASSLYNFLLIGLILVVLGLIIIVISRKNSVQ